MKNSVHAKAARRHTTADDEDEPGKGRSCGMFDEEQVVRLLAQALDDLGYSNVSKSLQKEAGVHLKSDRIDQLEKHVLGGEFSLAEQLLKHKLDLSEKEISEAVYLLRKRMYLELLSERKLDEAIDVLQTQLTPLIQKDDKFVSEGLSGRDLVAWLSSLVLCTDRCDIERQTNCDLSLNGRLSFLTETESIFAMTKGFVPPEFVLPNGRWRQLYEQAIRHQIRECTVHVDQQQGEQRYSLYVDHRCVKKRFPTRKAQVLTAHRDEIWFVAFSISGEYLASGSKDGFTIVWKRQNRPSTTKYEILHSIMGHTDSVGYIGWSPNDQYFVTCSSDTSAKLWDISGDLMQTITAHRDTVSCCAWFSDSQRFVTGGPDRSIYLWVSAVEFRCNASDF